jgi:hypothetical protein
VREDEVAVKIDGLLVVLGRLGQLSLDEVCLSPVVENIWVVRVMLKGGLEIGLGLTGPSFTGG